jgi:hypothetical protein
MTWIRQSRPDWNVSARTRPAAVAVRDSKDPDGPKLIFTPEAWATFTTTLRTAGSG